MYLKKIYYWNKIGPEIKQVVLSCDLCQRVKCINMEMGGALNLVESLKPGDLVCVDFYGLLSRSNGGLQYTFIVLDAFSKCVKLYPIKKQPLSH